MGEGIKMDMKISIESLIAAGLYEWDITKPMDEKGRSYLRRTPKGDRAMAFWSGEDLKALTNLLQLAATKQYSQADDAVRQKGSVTRHDY